MNFCNMKNNQEESSEIEIGHSIFIKKAWFRFLNWCNIVLLNNLDHFAKVRIKTMHFKMVTSVSVDTNFMLRHLVFMQKK